jgi:hypothetical protein
MAVLRFVTFLFAFLSLSVFAQNENYTFLVDDMCKRLDVNEFKSLDRTQMNLKLQQLGEEIRADHPDRTERLMDEIYEEYPGVSEAKARSIYLTGFLELALDSCQEYADIIVMSVGSCPDENESLKIIREEVDSYISKHTKSTYMEQYYGVMNQLDKIFKNHEELILNDYPSGIKDQKLVDDAIVYLSYKSKPFLKVIVLGQIEMAMGGQ